MCLLLAEGELAEAVCVDDGFVDDPFEVDCGEARLLLSVVAVELLLLVVAVEVVLLFGLVVFAYIDDDEGDTYE